MTYQQVFDEAMGDVPVSTVDVERVIERQRRARRLRLGAAGAAVVAAVLAVVLGTNALVAPHAKAPTTDVSPAPSTIPGTPEDLDRIDAAVVAALVRAEPSLVWSADGVDSGTTPNWESRAGSTSADATLASGYTGEGEVRIASTEVRVTLSIERDGNAAWERLGRDRCDTEAARTCEERTGPDGQRIRTVRESFEQEVPEKLRDQVPSRGEAASARVLRRDGSLVIVGAMTSGREPHLPLTADQLIAVASDAKIALAPLPSAAPAPTSTVTTVAGTAEDRARLGAALTAAMKRQAPNFTWVTKWGGPVASTPVWSERNGHLSVNAPYLGYASYRIGDRSGGVSLGLRRDGETAWRYASPCPTAGLAGRNCTVTDGPTGEKIRARHLVTDLVWRDGVHQPALRGPRRIEVLRPDGTYLLLSVSGGETVLSMPQLIDVALDPALTLAPPPPAGEVSAKQISHWMFADDQAAGATAAAAALADVSREGIMDLYQSGGRMNGLSGWSSMSFAFLVRRDGLAGDGEILVQRRLGAILTCATVRTLPPNDHLRHQHTGECAESTRPDGNRVVTVISRSSGTVTYTAFVQRPDRGTVEVVLDNRPNTGAATDMPEGGQLENVWPKGTKGGATPPLTLEQVVELAAHPDLVNLLP